MASIYLRDGSDIFYFDFRIGAKRFRGSTGERTARLAQKAADLREQEELLKERYSGTVSLLEAGARFFTMKDLSDKTVRNYKGSLIQLVTFLGDVSLDLINASHLKSYVAHRYSKGHKVAAKRDLAFLSSVYSSSRIWDDAPKTNPFSEFQMRDLEEAEARMIWLSEQEIERLLKVCTRDYQRRFVLLAVDTGMRSSEIMNLRWDEIDFKERFIYLGNRDKRRTKGKRGRVIPLTERTLATLLDTPLAQRRTWVFENPNTDRPITTLKTFWKRATTAAGLEGVRIHDLRHTFGSRSNHAGIDSVTLMAVLGHKSEAMLKRYAHPSHESLRKAVSKLDKHS